MAPFDSIRRICRLIIAFGPWVVLASNVALAQPVPSPVVAWPGLSPGDIERMHAAAARLYEGRSIGTVERWRNPDSKDAGEVKLVRSFETHGMPCRTIDYTVRYQVNQNGLDHYVVNWCMVSAGTWKIVELGRQP
jgi:surface antigen